MDLSCENLNGIQYMRDQITHRALGSSPLLAAEYIDFHMIPLLSRLQLTKKKKAYSKQRNTKSQTCDSLGFWGRMINGVQVILRSAEGAVNTTLTLGLCQMSSVACVCVGRKMEPNRKSQARHYYRDTVLKQGGGGEAPLVPPKEQFVFRFRAPCGAAYELQSSCTTTAASGQHQRELLLVHGFILTQECRVGGCFALRKLSLI